MGEINRRDFLKVLGAATLSPLVHASPEARARARKIYLRRVHIAGFPYYDGVEDEVFDNLAVGDELELRRQPDNPHDKRAIEVYTADGHKLGYIPQVNNRIPANLADQNVAIGAEICFINETQDDYPAVGIRLYMIIPDLLPPPP